jgi:hypothetical protein
MFLPEKNNTSTKTSHDSGRENSEDQYGHKPKIPKAQIRTVNFLPVQMYIPDLLKERWL